MPDLGTMFTCGGGFEAGAIAAGYTPVFGIEIDPKPAAAYRQNFGDHIVVADVRDYDFSGVRVDHLHASPSCKSSSTANKNRGETQFDVECALAVCRAIAQISPDTFSLENVVCSATMKPLEGNRINAFNTILECLHRLGYRYEYRTLNAADYGVPQTRKRLILIATKQGYPVFPTPTHSKPTPQKNLFELPNWVTWYEAIADLIPTLKKTDLAPWQRQAVYVSTLFGKDRTNGLKEVLTRDCDSPSFTLRSSAHLPRIVLTEGLLLHGTDNGYKKGSCFTRDDRSPCFTLKESTYKGMPKIALIEKDGARSDRPLRQIPPSSPAPTSKALGQDGHWQQWVIQNGVEILQVDIRCLARLQSFPERYQFPESKPVACSLIGNSVPPLLAQKIMEVIAATAAHQPTQIKQPCLAY